MNQNPVGAPDGAPADPRESNIRGVWKLKDRTDRPTSPYGVQWRSDAGKPKEFFATERSRDERYADLVKKAKKGTLRDEPTRQEMLEYRAFKAATGPVPWQDVVQGWRNDLKRTRGGTDKTVAIAVRAHLELAKAQKEAGEISSGFHCHLKNVLTQFGDAFGANRLHEPQPEDVEEWIDSLGWTANGTFNNYRKMIRRMFEQFRKEVVNPCDEIPTRSEISKIGINTVPEVAKLFAYALANHRDALGRLALEAFAGLRFSSAYRLEKNDINFDDKGILLPAAKLKTGIQTGRRHYIDGLPENLWSWLEATNDGCWAMTNTDWMHLKSRLFVDAKVPHPFNCLRHDFCTYHVAAHKNPGLTATILCHRNQQRLWSNYNGGCTPDGRPVRKADGLLYFTITPQNAAQLAELPIAA